MAARTAARAVLAATMFATSIAGHASGDPGPRASLGDLARSGRLTRRAVEQAQRADWSFIQGQSYRTVAARGTTVLHQGDAELAAQVGALVAEVRLELAGWLGPPDAQPLRVFLVRDAGRLLSCGSASYEQDSAIHLAVRTRERNAASDRRWLLPALRHELVHLATIPKRAGKLYLPWISEGLAYYLESRPDFPDARAWLGQQTMPPDGERCRSWRELDEWSDFYRTARFDTQSAAVFGILEASAGPSAVRRFSECYFDGGQTDDEAFIAASDLPMEELEVSWRSLSIP